ncbi:MAG: hypothetical protein U0610_00870 [bacterium]
MPIPTAFDETPSQQRPSELARLLLVMVFLHKRLIVWLVAVTVVVTTVLCFTLPKIYSGSFSVIVKGSDVDTSAIVPGSMVQTGMRPVTPQMVANEQRILSSATLADRVLADLRTRHDELRFSWAEEAEPRWLRAVTRAIGGAPHALKALVVKEPDPADSQGKLPGDPLIPALRAIVEVSPGVGNDVIDIRVKHFDGHLTEEILKTYLRVYTEQRSAIWSNAAAPEFYRKQTDLRLAELDAVNQEIQRIKADPTLVAPTEEKNRLVKQLGEMITELNKLDVREDELVSLASRAQASSARGIRALGVDGTSSDPMLREISARMGQLEGQRAEMLRNFSPTSPMVQAVDRELGTLSGQYKAIVTEFLSNDLTSVRSRKQQLTAQITDLKNKIPAVEEAEQRLSVLEQRRKIALEQVNQFQRKEGEVDVYNQLRSSLLPNVAVISEPYVSPSPLFPQRGTLIPLSFAVGLFLGVVAAVLFELLDDSFKLPEQIVRELGVPVLATYPLEQTA